MKERNSVTREIAERYRHSERKSKKAILNEYIQLAGLPQKIFNFNNTTIRNTKVESPQKQKLNLNFCGFQAPLLTEP